MDELSRVMKSSTLKSESSRFHPGVASVLSIAINRINLSRSQDNICSHAYNPRNHSRRLRVMIDCATELYITRARTHKDYINYRIVFQTQQK